MTDSAAESPRFSRIRRAPINYALLSIFLVPLAATTFRLALFMMSNDHYHHHPLHTSIQPKEHVDATQLTSKDRSVMPSEQRSLQQQQKAQGTFVHGVASGDPLADAVVIWTRITIDDTTTTTTTNQPKVSWQVATDSEFTLVVAKGTERTSADQDYTVKVDVTGLKAYRFYYYKFTYCYTANNCVDSVTGRTKTAPSHTSPNNDVVQQLRFATVSCSSIQWGYFHAYDRLSERSDIDVVLHLGDYIYEYANGEFGQVRDGEPPTATVTLEDYRLRYAQYRREASLKNLHQRYPFITAWDDHEFADNAARDQAPPESHDSTLDGSWIDRRRAAATAYREWMPFRPQKTNADGKAIKKDRQTITVPWNYNLYRCFHYGNLVDIFVLDSRIVGRDQQFAGLGHLMFLPEYFSENRDMLGTTQMEWLKAGLRSSNAKWKVLMQTVMFTPVNIMGLIAHNSDAWDGYNADRAELMGFIVDNEIDNVVILTGDIHSTLIADVPKQQTAEIETYWDWVRNLPGRLTFSQTYESIAVEFVVTSVSSVTIFESGFLGNIPFGTKVVDFILGTVGLYLNPHGKYFDTLNRGYQIIDFQPDKVQTDIYFTGPATEEKDTISADQQYEISWFSLDGDNFLQMSSIESAVREEHLYQDTFF